MTYPRCKRCGCLGPNHSAKGRCLVCTCPSFVPFKEAKQWTKKLSAAKSK